MSNGKADAKIKITWGGYVNIELTGQQWGKIQQSLKKSSIDACFTALVEVAVTAGFKVTLDQPESVYRISVSNITDVFGDGKQYVMQAGSKDLHEALAAALEKFSIWTKMPPAELPLVGSMRERF